MAEKKEQKKEARKETPIKDVLQKAYLNGIVPMIRLAQNGAFEIMDPNHAVLVMYKGQGAQVFPEEIGVFNLAMLLDMLKTMADPKIAYKDGLLLLEDGGKKFEYITAHPSVITTAYAPEKKADHVLTKLQTSEASAVFTLEEGAVGDIRKGCGILKDASVVQIVSTKKGTKVVIGAANEHKFTLDIDAKAGSDVTVVVPKREFQAILEACPGKVFITMRGAGAPVLIEEADVKFLLNQVE